MKPNPNPVKRNKKISWLEGHYESIRDSRVSWRRKGSYRKRIKNRINKTIRHLLKKELLKDPDL